MSTFLDLVNDIALVVGGTKVAAPPPGFYSGAQQNGGAGDGTGVQGLNGCYALAPLNFEAAPPIGIIVPRTFNAKLMQQGYEENSDRIRLLVLVAKVDLATDLAILYPFRDTVPAAFRAHMQVDQVAGATTLTPEPLMVFAVNGRCGAIVWGGIAYYGWDFELEVLRTPQITYSP